MSSAQDKTAGYEAGGASAGTPSASSPSTPGAHRETAGYRADYDTGRGAANGGFTVLAATLMMLAGFFGVLEGLVAILRQGFFVTSQSNYIYQFNLHGWGWLHLAIGVVLFAAGACVLLGQTWARVVGIVLAVFSGLANFIFLPYYPVWSIIVIAIDVFIIWALATGMSRRATA
jgi:hypothetical protein